MTRLIPIFVFGLSLPAWGAEVLRIGKDSQSFAVTHDEKRTWQAQDRVCFLQRAQEIACGVVTKSTSKGAIVRLEAPNYDVVVGDKAIGKRIAAIVTSKREPTAVLLNSVADSADSDVHYFNVTLGAGLGTSFFYPQMGFQVAITPNLAIGASGTFLSAANAPVNLMAIGGSGTIAFYSQEYFRGLWIQASGGLTSISVRGGVQDEDATCFTGSFMVGWRAYWDFGFNIGAAAGVNYLADPNFTTITTSASGIHPAVNIDLGFNF
ncbi:hypothetical protein K2X33_01430 [bacterium]|nr:hypothetical protein [bacterium]